MRLVTFTLMVLSVCHAQEFRSTISGKVTDAQQAAVPRAQVRVEQVSTRAVSSGGTNIEGQFSLPFLAPGTESLFGSLELRSPTRVAGADRGPSRIHGQPRRQS